VKLLLDACVWGGALATVRAAGHDVVWAGEWDENPSDDEIVARAAREARTLVTLDKDFGELAVVHRLPHAGIVRLVGFRASDQGPKIVETVERYSDDLGDGAIVTVEPGRVRVRPSDVEV
jgi:predicted nuclease of predicted toxin-antitoxin system